MATLLRATSGFHRHDFRDEQVPNRPTHAAHAGARVALCGASVQQVFTRRWGTGPTESGCAQCASGADLHDAGASAVLTIR